MCALTKYDAAVLRAIYQSCQGTSDEVPGLNFLGKGQGFGLGLCHVDSTLNNVNVFNHIGVTVPAALGIVIFVGIA